LGNIPFTACSITLSRKSFHQFSRLTVFNPPGSLNGCDTFCACFVTGNLDFSSICHDDKIAYISITGEQGLMFTHQQIGGAGSQFA